LFIYRGQISAIVTFKEEYEHIPFTKMPTNHGPLEIYLRVSAHIAQLDICFQGHIF